MTALHEFQTDVRDHGRKQLELKNHYPLTSSRKERYILDAWMYFPASLGVNKGHNVQRFLSNTICLTRFSTTHIPLSRLIDPDCEISPLSRIRKELSKASLKKDIKYKRLIYELRSLANIYSSEISATEKIIGEAVKKGQMTFVKDTIRTKLKDIGLFLAGWRELYGLFLAPAVEPRLREAYFWTDESTSLATEHVLFELHRQIETDVEALSLIEPIRELMDRELMHRRTMGYHTLSPKTTAIETERRIFRESTLKKWSHSVLYLSQEESGTSRRMGHILAGIAAATAMTFAVVATIFAERFFPGRSLPWALVIIVAYIFKDRIKEVLRNILNHTMPGLITDQRIRLVDQATGHKVGKVKSRVRFLAARSAPTDIKRMRLHKSIPFQKLLPEEDLIHFRREIIIHNNLLRDSHTRLESLSDIIRIKLDGMLDNMDDPEKAIPTFATNEPVEISGDRVYHINLVVCLSRKSGTVGYNSRYRLIANRNGLVRIDTVLKPE